MSTKTGQSSKAPSQSCHFNPIRLYLTLDMPDYDDPSLKPDATITDTRELVGFSVNSILEPGDIRELEWGTAGNLASACRAGRQAIEELVTDVERLSQKKRPGEKITNATLLSKLGELKMKKSKYDHYKLTILEPGPSQSEFQARGFRKFKVHELQNLEKRVNGRGKKVEDGEQTVPPGQTVNSQQTVTSEEQADTVRIFDGDDV